MHISRTSLPYVFGPCFNSHLILLASDPSMRLILCLLSFFSLYGPCLFLYRPGHDGLLLRVCEQDIGSSGLCSVLLRSIDVVLRGSKSGRTHTRTLFCLSVSSSASLCLPPSAGVRAHAWVEFSVPSPGLSFRGIPPHFPAPVVLQNSDVCFSKSVRLWAPVCALPAPFSDEDGVWSTRSSLSAGLSPSVDLLLVSSCFWWARWGG